jgi:hypothetical protein
MNHALGVWKRELTKTRGPASAAEFAARLEARCRALRDVREVPSHPALRMHLHDHILPGLALYQELRAEGLDKDAALAFASSLFEALAQPYRRRMARLGRLPGFFWLLRAAMRISMRRSYPPEGWTVEWVEISGRRIALDIHRCFYLDTLVAAGAPELAPLFCRNDDLAFVRMSSRVRWERTTTLARGGRTCDFRFVHTIARAG